MGEIDDLRTAWLPAVMDLVEETLRETTPEGSSLLAMAGYHFGTGGNIAAFYRAASQPVSPVILAGGSPAESFGSGL